jgi:2,3-dihydroxy-p-cumate/2,3-dihydroxybenzoate 3,4-dioxygenase
MIRHILLFSFRDDVDVVLAQRMLDDFSRFPECYPQMQNWQLGKNASRRDQSFDYAMTVVFSDWNAANTYLESEDHERFVIERFRPLIARRAIATFDVE